MPRIFRRPDLRALLGKLGVNVIAYVYVGCARAPVPVRARRRRGPG